MSQTMVEGSEKAVILFVVTVYVYWMKVIHLNEFKMNRNP